MWARTLLLSALSVFVLVCAPAAAVQEPEDHGRPHLDVRRGDRAAVPQRTQDAREALEVRLGDEASVDVEPAGGGLRSLGRTDDLLTAPRAGDPADIALAYLRSRRRVVGLDDADFDALRLAARYTSPNGVTHLTWQQTSRGLPSYDGLLTVNVAADGSIVNVTGTAVRGLEVPTATPALTPSSALAVAKADVRGAMLAPRAGTRRGPERRTRFSNGDTARLVAFADPDGDRLAWRLTVAGEAPYVYDEVVDAQTGRVLARHSLTEFASNAIVFDHHPGAAGTGGVAHNVDLSSDPQWMNRSTLTVPGKLDGRNAHTYADVGGGDGFQPGEDIPPSDGTDWLYPQVGVTCAVGAIPSSFTGLCTWNGTGRIDEPINRAQTTTQLHYFVNSFHDWLAAPPIGFTDASHNFEIGGTGGSDPLKAESDDASGFNNANMSTPPDGSRPRMQMYLFTNPVTNSSDDASIVYHEYTHGLAGRLINNGLGGGLTSDQSRAMGEGWSDWYALDYLVANGHVVDTPSDGDVVTGEYVTNNADRGIRRNAIDCAVGSTDTASCPGNTFVGAGGWTFDDMGGVGAYGIAPGDDRYSRFGVHDDGEIWSETLWDVRTAVGGAVARGLITEAMRLSPPNPSFLDSRDAILQADQVTGGTHHAALWAAFAARGMGYSARTDGPDATKAVAGFDVPPPVLVTAHAPSVTDPAPLGDGDARAESGETARLRVRLRNPAAMPLTNVRATLTSTTPGVTVGQPTVSYPDLGARAADASDIPFAITLPRSLPCTTVVALSLAVSADQGSLTLPLTLPLGTPGGTVHTASTGLPATIADRGANGQILVGGIVTMTVPDAGTISGARVTVSTDHDFIGDLHARLTAPDGTTVELFERPGSGVFGSGAGGMTSVVFADDAATGIQGLPAFDGTFPPPITGTYRPDEPLARLDGRPQAGEWRLRIFDALNGGTGAITGFAVQPVAGTPSCSTTAPAPPTVTTTPATTVDGDSATLNGTLDPGGADTQYQFEYGTTTAYGQVTPTATAASGSGPAARSARVTGLAPDTAYHYRLVARRAGTVVAVGADSTFISSQAPPEAVTGAASDVTVSGATLNAIVDANGVATGFRFDYGTTTAYGATTPGADGGNGADPVARSAPVTGLAPGTTYHFRVVALRGAAVAAVGADATFTTLQTPPAAVTGAASDVTSTGATLNGTVDAVGFATAFRFDYGLTDAYGSTTAAGDAGGAAGALARSSAVTGLTPATTYHFRIVALRGAAAAAAGTDATFTTTAAAAPTLSPAPTPGATATPTATRGPEVTVSGVPTKVRIDRRRRLTFAFTATPAGVRGAVALVAVKTRVARAIKLGSARFTTPAEGKVQVVVKVSRKAVARLRRLRRVKGAAQITLGGKVFRATFRIAAAQRRR